MLAPVTVTQATAPIVVASAQCDEPSICGRVTDDQGAPVDLAVIVFSAGTQTASAVSDDDGRFVIRLPSGTTVGTITVRAVTFDDRVVTIDARRARDYSVIVSPASDGGAILVTGRRISSAFAATRRTRLEVLTSPSSRADVLLAIADLPGSTGVDGSADIQLRGGSAGLSRAYLNDIPLYEVVRGTFIDRVTRKSSIVNASIVHDVEVYPTNPPLYLANSAGGAVRILPEEAVSDRTTTLFAGLSGVSATRTFGLGGDRQSFVQTYMTLTSLDAVLAVNADLKRTTTSFRAAAAGASAKITLTPAADLKLVGTIDTEHGKYPLKVLNIAAPSDNRRTRYFLAASVEAPVAGARAKLDAAITQVDGAFALGGARTTTQNNYLYADADISGKAFARAVDYRVGLTVERFYLKAQGAIPALGQGDGATRLIRTASYAELYGFATLHPATSLTLSVGTRQYLTARDALGANYSVGLQWVSADARHRFSVGAGTYSSLVPQDMNPFAPIVAANSRQLSLDYFFKGSSVRGQAGVFAKADRFAEVVTDIRGFDAGVTADVSKRLSLEGNVAVARTRSHGTRGSDDLPFIVRLSAHVAIGSTASANVQYVVRSGAVFTPVIGATAQPGGGFNPIFAPTSNGERLSVYASADVNVINRIGFWPGRTKPLGFVSVTNILNRPNVARVAYGPDYSTRLPVLYERRAVYFGLVFQF